jgi:hypothetical protein
MTPEQFNRFVAKIHFVERDEDFGECWEWCGSRWDRYGRFYVHSRAVSAHRIAFEHFVGPIADGLDIDHLCRNTFCVNPRHLEAVTASLNVLRGLAPMRVVQRNHSEAHRRIVSARMKGRVITSEARRKISESRTGRPNNHIWTPERKAALVEKLRRIYQAAREKTHCKHGHAFTPQNTYERLRANGSVKRACKTCLADSARRLRKAKAA